MGIQELKTERALPLKSMLAIICLFVREEDKQLDHHTKTEADWKETRCARHRKSEKRQMIQQT